MRGAGRRGKSTAALQLYCDRVGDGVAAAYVEIDQRGMCYPAEPEDPDRHRLKVRALAAVVPNYAGVCRRRAACGVRRPGPEARRVVPGVSWLRRR